MLIGGCGLRDTSMYYYIHAPNQTVIPLRVIPIYIDQEFGEADKIEIDNAIGQWNFAFNGYVKLEAVDWHFQMETNKIIEGLHRGGWFILKVDSNNEIVQGHQTRALAFANKISGNYIYIIRDRIQTDDIKYISMHEMGHLLGSDHIGKLLMFPYYNKSRFQCIDWDTLQEVARAQHLEVSNLNYCIYGIGNDPGHNSSVSVDE